MRIRKTLSGTADIPRMSVFRSNKQIYVQLIDDIEGKTLCGLSTKSASVKGPDNVLTRSNVNFAKTLGTEMAKTATEKGITKVVFDRAGHLYHGVIKALADAAREGGLKF